MSSTQDLIGWMQHDPTFVGVFPLDGIPHLPASNMCGFIVNTHTANLGGQHWIAVRIVQDQAWIFDPLAFPPIPELCEHLVKHCQIRCIHVSTATVQPINTQTCGPHCVYFLYTATPAPSEDSVLSFVSSL